MEDLALALRLARIAVGREQREIADAVQVHPVFFNAVERGRRVPSARLARAMVAELNKNKPRSPLAQRVLREANRVLERSLASG